MRYILILVLVTVSTLVYSQGTTVINNRKVNTDTNIVKKHLYLARTAFSSIPTADSLVYLHNGKLIGRAIADLNLSVDSSQFPFMYSSGKIVQRDTTLPLFIGANTRFKPSSTFNVKGQSVIYDSTSSYLTQLHLLSNAINIQSKYKSGITYKRSGLGLYGGIGSYLYEDIYNGGTLYQASTGLFGSTYGAPSAFISYSQQTYGGSTIQTYTDLGSAAIPWSKTYSRNLNLSALTSTYYNNVPLLYRDGGYDVRMTPYNFDFGTASAGDIFKYNGTKFVLSNDELGLIGVSYYNPVEGIDIPMEIDAEYNALLGYRSPIIIGMDDFGLYLTVDTNGLGGGSGAWTVGDNIQVNQKDTARSLVFQTNEILLDTLGDWMLKRNESYGIDLFANGGDGSSSYLTLNLVNSNTSLASQDAFGRKSWFNTSSVEDSNYVGLHVQNTLASFYKAIKFNGYDISPSDASQTIDMGTVNNPFDTVTCRVIQLFDGENIYIDRYKVGYWEEAYSWGNHATFGYLTSESDPVFIAHDAYDVTSTLISNWNTAYGWGDHSEVGYFSEAHIPLARIDEIGIKLNYNEEQFTTEEDRLNINMDWLLSLISTGGAEYDPIWESEKENYATIAAMQDNDTAYWSTIQYSPGDFIYTKARNQSDYGNGIIVGGTPVDIEWSALIATKPNNEDYVYAAMFEGPIRMTNLDGFDEEATNLLGITDTKQVVEFGFDNFATPSDLTSKMDKAIVDVMGGGGYDSTQMLATTGYTQMPLGYSQGFVIDTIVFVVIGANCNVTFKVWYGPTPMSGGTAVVTAGNAITSTNITKVSTFNNATVAKGNAMWATITSVTTVPRRVLITILGHRI